MMISSAAANSVPHWTVGFRELRYALRNVEIDKAEVAAAKL